MTVEQYVGEYRDATPQLTRIKNWGAGLHAVIGGNAVPAIATKQAKQLGAEMPIFGPFAIANPDFVGLATDGAEGVYSSGAINLDTPKTARSCTRYRSKSRREYAAARGDCRPGFLQS